MNLALKLAAEMSADYVELLAFLDHILAIKVTDILTEFTLVSLTMRMYCMRKITDSDLQTNTTLMLENA